MDEACPQWSQGILQWMCLVRRNKKICGLGVGSETFMRYWAFYEVKGLRHDPEEPKVCVIEWVLSQGTRIYIEFSGGHLNGFWDKMKRIGYIQGQCHWLDHIKSNKNIYGLGVGIWTVYISFDIIRPLFYSRLTHSPFDQTVLFFERMLTCDTMEQNCHGTQSTVHIFFYYFLNKQHIIFH